MTPKETGSLGEAYAQRYLLKQGYAILETNWRKHRAEIDIIAKDGDILVFVEVKTRSSDYFGGPSTTLTDKQKRLISSAAGSYMREINHDWEIRFDLIAILLEDNGDYRLEHLPDAFFWGLH